MVCAETAVRAETGVIVVVAEGFCVALGETSGVGAGLPDGVSTSPGSSWTESHRGPSSDPAANGPTPVAALPPMPITPSDPMTSHAVRLVPFISHPSWAGANARSASMTSPPGPYETSRRA